MATSIQGDSGQPSRPRSPRDTSQMYRLVQEQVVEHPYRTLALAAGVGFVLGGGLLTRATGRLVAAGLRLGVASLVAPVATQIVEQMRKGSGAAQKRR